MSKIILRLILSEDEENITSKIKKDSAILQNHRISIESYCIPDFFLFFVIMYLRMMQKRRKYISVCISFRFLLFNVISSVRHILRYLTYESSTCLINSTY